jgi:hypothetical protein
MRFYMAVMLGLLMALNSHSAFAKWDEERDVTGSGNQDLVYYYKINAEGQKLVLDKYVKRLIFIQQDRLHKRTIRQIKIDGVPLEVMSDPFSHYPAQTAITFENKDEVLKRLFLAKKIEVEVRYGRDQGLSVFQIK